MLRVLCGFGLAFLVGAERAMRGSVAGDRTFSLVGGAATAITAVTIRTSPQTVAGVITGVGFIGAGVVIHEQAGLIRGITTAASVFGVAGVGVVVGTGHVALGGLTTGLALLVLELPYLPGIRYLDPTRLQSRFRQEPPLPPESQQTAR